MLILLSGIVIILFITRIIWKPTLNKYHVRIVSLAIATSIIMTYGFWQILLDAIIETYFPYIAKNFQYVPPILIFIFIGFTIWIVNYFNRDSTAMGKHLNSIEKEFPNISIEKEIEGIISSLSDELRSIDIQTNWSSQYFTPLDAEVEVIKGNSRKKKIMDLLLAIRKSEDRLFLVLGDPGSGKSVSLRKLCLDLSKETKKTEKIPIYVNLKEWQIDGPWDRENPPTTNDLMQFVLSNLGKRDVFISKFFNRRIGDQTYFERLYLTGHLFFVFDSFDEIPPVLNEDENSWLIRELSKVIFTFLKGTRGNSSQGILASRLFRRPTQEFQCTTTLEIRPFSEKKIIRTFERNGKISNIIIRDFFTNCSHLVPIARNPFTATLISEYIDFNNGSLPQTHAELFENYLNQLLDNCKDQIKKKKISKEQIISFAKEIATLMYNSIQGWEIETQALRNINPNADKYIDILKFARIGRGNTGDEGIFSFAHRRFAEYFMAKNMLDNNKEIDLRAIPKDSQLRDALVLYCEIADDEAATKIAEFCWEIITTVNDLQNIEVIHALRFLRDAFRGRKECIRNFNTQLAEYMRKQITEYDNMLSVKIIVECVSLLDDDNKNENIFLALELDNYWITETAFYSCRNISNLSKEVMSKFEDFFDEKIPVVNLLQSYSEYKFSLTLSESFSKLLFWIKFKIFDFLIFLVTFIYVLISPLIYLYISKYIFFILFFPLVIPVFLFLFFSYTISPHNGVVFIKMKYRKVKNSIIRVAGCVYIFSIWLFRFVVEINFLCIPTLLFLLCSILYPISIILEKMSVKRIMLDTKTWITIGKRIGFFIIIGCIVWGLTYIESKFVSVKVILNFILFGIIGVVGVLAILIIFKAIIIPFISDSYKYYCERRLLERIDFASQSNREIIYNQFISFDNDKVRLKYINLLELYVHNVSGEWPNKNIFSITSNPAYIRLAQLEEKWLGVNR